MKKRIAVLSIGLIAVIGAAGCAETKDTAEPAEASAAAEPDKNQDIADLYAKTAPKDLAQVCSTMPTVGRAVTEKMATNILGSQIIKMGGDVEAVVDNLLDRC